MREQEQFHIELPEDKTNEGSHDSGMSLVFALTGVACVLWFGMMGPEARKQTQPQPQAQNQIQVEKVAATKPATETATETETITEAITETATAPAPVPAPQPITPSITDLAGMIRLEKILSPVEETLREEELRGFQVIRQGSSATLVLETSIDEKSRNIVARKLARALKRGDEDFVLEIAGVAPDEAAQWARAFERGGLSKDRVRALEKVGRELRFRIDTEVLR